MTRKLALPLTVLVLALCTLTLAYAVDTVPAASELRKSACLALRGGDSKQAEQLFSQFLLAYPDSKEAAFAQLTLANLALRGKDTKDAETKLQAVVDKYPSSPLAPKAMLSIIYLHTRAKADRPSLIAQYENLLAKYPDRPQADDARFRIAKLWQAGPPDLDKAIRLFSELKSSTKNARWQAECMIEIALSHIQRYYRTMDKNPGKENPEDFKTGLQMLADVRLQFPGRAVSICRAETRLARYYMERLGDQSKAEKMLNTVASEHPKTPGVEEAKYHLAAITKSKGDLDGCISQCRQILKDHPKSGWCDYILYYIGSVYYEKGDRTAATDTFKQVIVQYPNGLWANVAVDMIGKMVADPKEGGEK